MPVSCRLPRRAENASTIPSGVGYTIHRHKRFWEVCDPKGRLVCLTVYKRGAKEVVRRLSG